MSSASLGLTLRRPFGSSQTVSYTGAAGVTSNPLPDSCASVMVWCTTAACVGVSNSSSYAATTSSIPLPANVPVILPVERPTAPGTANQMYVGAIQIASSGTMYVQPLAD